ncbi:MAG TPA: hypothetical protein DCG85_02470 [Lachnospiraceae bacterium]|nr:hypothetical protein [Lachnospiraceae bacterium]
MKKKLYLSFILLASVILISGCAQTDGRLLNKLKASSSIYSDEDYLSYLKLKEKDQIDKNGLYSGTGSLSENEVKEGSIHLTFAKNRFIRMSYYKDKDRTERLTTLNCYVNPGDTIYATVGEIDNPYSEAFMFKGFRLISYSESGKRGKTISGNGLITDEEAGDLSDEKEEEGKEEDKKEGDKKEDKKDEKKDDKKEDKKEFIEEGALVEFTIPSDFKGIDLSVEPLGEYQKVEISTAAYVKDAEGKKTAVGSADFYVDGELVIGDKTEINAGKEYVVSLKYNGEDYYYVGSNPKSRVNDKPGEVIFATADGKSASASYEVELHPYINVTFDGSGDLNSILSIKNTDVNINGRTLEKMKGGQALSVDTQGEYRLFCKDIEFNESETDTGYHYQFTIPQTDKKNLTIRVSDQMKTVRIPSVEHGKVSVRLLDNGSLNLDGDETEEEITGEVYLEDGEEADGTSTVEVKITPDDGYYVSGRNVTDRIYVQTMRLSSYVDNIDSIISEHPIKPLIAISVDPSDQYGNCVFKLNGVEVSGEVYVMDGDRLTLDYTLTTPGMSIARKDGNILTSLIDAGADLISYPTRSETINIYTSDEGRRFTRADFFEVVNGVKNDASAENKTDNQNSSQNNQNNQNSTENSTAPEETETKTEGE